MAAAEPRSRLVPSKAELERNYQVSRGRDAKPEWDPSTSVCSASRASTPARSVCSDNGSDADNARSFSKSLRRRMASRSKSRNWRPELTVPCGPNLRTAVRPRARSRSVDASPARSVSSNRSARRSGMGQTPIRSSSRTRGGPEAPSPAPSCRSARSAASSRSDMSLASCSSRISRLSQRSCSKHIKSSAELEQEHVERLRADMKDLLRRNEESCHKALYYPDVPNHNNHGGKVTVPSEFNLSVGNLSVRSGHSDAGRGMTPRDWSCSLRRSSASASPSRRSGQPALTKPKPFDLSVSNVTCHAHMARGSGGLGGEEPRNWPKLLRQSSETRSVSAARGESRERLTVPEAPALRTESRATSRSASATEDSRSTSRQRSMSRHDLPREQAAIERHLQRTHLAQTSEDWPRAPPQPRGNRPTPVPGSAEERAEQARAAAEAKREAALAEEKKRLCIFKKAEAQSDGAAVAMGKEVEAAAKPVQKASRTGGA